VKLVAAPSKRREGGRRRLTQAAAAAGVCTLLLVTAWAAAAQTQSYCTITDVKVKQLSNAVCVTLEADGAMRVEVDIFEYAYWSTALDKWILRQLDKVHFRLPNARSAIGNFVDISAYPVSYLALSIPSTSPEGIGLDCTLALYRPAGPGRTNVDNEQWDGEWDSDWGEEPAVRVMMEKSQDGRKLYITVTSDRYVEVGEEKPGVKAAPAEHWLSVTVNREGMLSIRALNADIREAIERISQLSGLRVIVDDAVEHELTCRLDEMPAIEALETIAHGCGVAVARLDGTYYVSEALPTEVASYLPSETATMPLQHLTASEALPLLPDCVLRYARPNSDGNALVATGPQVLIEKLREDIAALDKPGMQFSVRASLVEFMSEEEAARALALLVGSGNTEIGFDTSGAAPGLNFAVVDKRTSEIRAQMGWLQSHSNVTIATRPRVVVRNGEQAEVFWGQQRYFKFVAATWHGPETQIKSVNIGVRLRATPWGASREYIMVPVEIEANSLVAMGSGGVPTVATRRATATVAVKSGQTVVIGGLALVQPSIMRQRVAPRGVPSPLAEAMTGSQRQRRVREVIILLQVNAI